MPWPSLETEKGRGFLPHRHAAARLIFHHLPNLPDVPISPWSGRDMLSPATTDAPSQVPTLNALEAEESTASDASLAMDDRIGLSRAVAKLAKELRKVSVTRREHAVLRKEEMEADEARKAAIAAATQHHQCSENFERLARGGESKTRQEPVTAEPVAVQEFRPVAATVSSLQGLFASPNLPVELRRFPQMLAEVLQSRTTSESVHSSRTVSKSDLEAAAIAMAQKMVDLEGQLGSVQSSWVQRLQAALARQREQEAELEKELHLQRLHLRHLTHDIAEAKLRRQQLEEEQAEFVPFATKELEDAMQQVANNRRAPESLRRLVNATAAPRVAFDPPRQKTRSSSTKMPRTQRAPRRGFVQATFGRIPV
eukprot:symbB.v1.2.028320.t2/scaffold2879.1/size76250/2